MRNVFDQYKQPENRLTHALISSLSEDRQLLSRFVTWVTGKRVPRSASLQIVEQGLPGEEVEEAEAERRGLPDACIFREDGWALLIESKIQATLSLDQLRRHLRTVQRRGFEDVELLAIDTADPPRALPFGARHRKWSEVYAWLATHSERSEWAMRAARYFVVAENRLVEEEYLHEGTLTTFAGIPFREGENPYTYPEAKRLLKLAMDHLRRDRELVKKLGMDAKGAGRPSITGKDGSAVWDFLPIKGLKRGELFTRQPHLTLAIQRSRVLAIVTVPHGIRPKSRRNLVNLGPHGFEELLADVSGRLVRALRRTSGAVPWVDVVQRRYPSQKAEAITDARIEFDLRTAFPEHRRASKVRPQPQWLAATYEALAKKQSNLQIGVGASFPYRTCSATRDPGITECVAQSWLACRPLIDVMLTDR